MPVQLSILLAQFSSIIFELVILSLILVGLNPTILIEHRFSQKASLNPLLVALEIQRYSKVGGHTFYGLERFLPGSWDIWMNYRDPLSRLNSGILRFYSKKFKSTSTSRGHLIDLEGNTEINLEDPHSVDLLLKLLFT